MVAVYRVAVVEPPPLVSRRIRRGYARGELSGGVGSGHAAPEKSTEGSMLKQGDKTPRVTGVSYDGVSFDLGAPGKRTVLFFYPKANTGG
jgi:hypothetical protein